MKQKKERGRGMAAVETPPPGANPTLDRLSANGQDEPFAPGDILCINEGELAVYFQPSPDGESDMVFSLLADGSVRLDSLQVETLQPTPLGSISQAGIARLEADGRWSRELIALGCAKPEFAALIPSTAAAAGGGNGAEASVRRFIPPEPLGEADEDDEELIFDLIDDDTPLPTAAPKHSRRFKLRRGQQVTVRFGGRSWGAVYWGRDHIGAVVAHNSNGSWELLRLDLERYKDSILVDPEISQELIDEVGAYLAKAGANGR